MRTHLAFLIVALCLLGRGPVSGGDTHLHSAITPQPRSDQWWKDRTAQIEANLEKTPDTELLFVGDSITQGWEGAGKQVWAKHYAPRKAVNFGIGGDRTQHVLWRLENAPLNNLKPKVAVVMIGTNNSNGEDNTPGQIVEGVRAIITSLRQRLPQTKVLLLGIFPRGENFNAQRGKLAQINQVLAKLQDQEGVIYLDIGHAFLNAEGLLPAAIMPDYLHLSPEGYAIWAEAMESTLAQLCEGGATTAVDPSGEWIWTIRGPNGEMVEAPLILDVKGSKVTGTFYAEAERKLPIESGTLTGSHLKLTVPRQRPQGGSMTYEMSGTIEGDRIRGQVKTTFEGETRTEEWSARRKP